MDKLEIELTEEELKIIKKEMKKNPNEKVRNKAKVLYLRYYGYTEREIIQKTDLTLCTILKYVKAFIANGISSIYTTGYKGQPSKLEPYKRTIKVKGLLKSIYGLKNFLLDFGNLEEKNYKEVYTRDYYLIYAVALGLNDNIPVEIMKMIS